MAEENEEQLIEGKKGGSKKLIIFLLILLVLLGGGGAAAYKFLILDRQADDEKKAEKIINEIKDVEEVGVQFEVGTFIVNLMDRDADRYLKVTVVLDLQDQTIRTEVSQRLPKIKDAITTLLFTKSSSELKTAEGIELLKEDVIKRVNAILPIGGVKNVYFTDFVIQTA